MDVPVRLTMHVRDLALDPQMRRHLRAPCGLRCDPSEGLGVIGAAGSVGGSMGGERQDEEDEKGARDRAEDPGEGLRKPLGGVQGHPTPSLLGEVTAAADHEMGGLGVVPPEVAEELGARFGVDRDLARPRAS